MQISDRDQTFFLNAMSPNMILINMTRGKEFTVQRGEIREDLNWRKYIAIVERLIEWLNKRLIDGTLRHVQKHVLCSCAVRVCYAGCVLKYKAVQY